MTKKDVKFVKAVWEYYERHGRRSLPWRKTKNPYRILVSEIMLQQTQVDRVLPKYRVFLKRFPSLASLADASLGDVLREWHGLGYNRRAKMLRECAQYIVIHHRGQTPMVYEELLALPGVGKYTSGAIMAFAYNEPVVMIETNVRSVILHHYFKDSEGVPDTEIEKVVVRTLDTVHPREWYYALMDYGVYIKKTFGNPNVRSRHYTIQSRFKGSDREIRGAILTVLARGGVRESILRKLPFDSMRIATQIDALTGEGMIVRTKNLYQLP